MYEWNSNNYRCYEFNSEKKKFNCLNGLYGLLYVKKKRENDFSFYGLPGLNAIGTGIIL